MKKSEKLLIGSDAIKSYLDISEPVFRKFLQMKLPAVLINNRWYAHTDNLDEYFKKITFEQFELEFPENGNELSSKGS